MQKIRIQQNQNLIDIALQGSGKAEGVFDIALANGLSVTDIPPPGTSLLIPSVLNTDIKSHYDSKGIEPATGNISFLNEE